MNQFVKPAPAVLPPAVASQAKQTESLFERFAWLYIFCREKLFRDDTKRMIKVLWPDFGPAQSTALIELGCGPGFYSCCLAKSFPQITVLGVDSSEKQLKWAHEKVKTLGLYNCVFECRNVLDLACSDGNFDCLIASRLFTVLPKRDRAVAEMFRVLKPHGRCFVAEPRFAFWASLPLFAMWLLAAITGYRNGYREPKRASVMSSQEFQQLLETQPWKRVKTWREGRYQYALCEKD